jgi:hypothetical protein
MKLNSDIISSFIKSDKFKESTDLCNLLLKYESDKCKLTTKYNGWHNYSSLYYFLFQDLENSNINFFEMGIFFGSSVRAFRDFFKNGIVYAGDYDVTTFLMDEGVNCNYCDQDNPESIKQLFDLLDVNFDIIIDDGKHEFVSNLNMLNNPIHKLKEGGIYIIEDLRFDVVDKFKNVLQTLKDDHNLSYVEIFLIDNESNNIDNNILIIQK